MSDGPLPNRVNIRKAVTRAARYSGSLGAEQLPRFETILDQRRVTVEVAFSRDEEGQAIAEVTLSAPVVLECQRCLGPLETTLSSHSQLALVLDDEQARHLPSRYEPWIALEDVDLWEMASEELALAMPVVSYHPEDECSVQVPKSTAPAEENVDGDAVSADNPFNVLSALLESGGDEEK